MKQRNDDPRDGAGRGVSIFAYILSCPAISHPALDIFRGWLAISFQRSSASTTTNAELRISRTARNEPRARFEITPIVRRTCPRQIENRSASLETVLREININVKRRKLALHMFAFISAERGERCPHPQPPWPEVLLGDDPLVKPNIQISQFVKSEVAFDTRRDQILYDRGNSRSRWGYPLDRISRSTKRGYCLPEATRDEKGEGGGYFIH